jgi:hypothetical protein
MRAYSEGQFIVQPFCVPIGDRHQSPGIMQRNVPFCYHLQEMVLLPLPLAHAQNAPFS